MGQPATWRAMTGDDLVAVDRIARIVHPGYPEDPAVMAERLRLFPAGCLVAIEPETGAHLGYAVAHPARPGHPPALDSLIGAVASADTALHVHDIALLPQTRRSGLGARVVRHLVQVALAAGLPEMSLVAVGDAAPYWERLGFRDSPTADGGVALASYGAAARYMVAPVARVGAQP